MEDFEDKFAVGVERAWKGEVLGGLLAGDYHCWWCQLKLGRSWGRNVLLGMVALCFVDDGRVK